MRLFTGDECGLLKECIPEIAQRPGDESRALQPNGAMAHVSLEGSSRVAPKEVQTRRRGVIDMQFIPYEEEEATCFATLRMDGTVELWNGSAPSQKFGKYTKVFQTPDIVQSVEPTSVRLRPLALGAFGKQSRLCAGDTCGNLTVLSLDNGQVVQRYNGYEKSKRGATITYTPGKNVNQQLATAMACDVDAGRVAIGGRERETTIMDLETGKLIFKAKNLPPDPQTLLQQPVWPSSIIFLEDSNTMAVGTAYKQLRLYDVRENTKTRRPILTTLEGQFEYSISSLCQISDTEIAVGDTAGNVLSVDIRTLGRKLKGTPSNNMGRFVGPAGCVRQLKKHPTLPRLSAVGLDRMLRVYDTNSRKQTHCMYLKQRLNCVLFASDGAWGAKEFDLDDEDIEGGIDADDVVRDYVDSDVEDQEDSDHSEEETGSDEDVSDGSDDGGDVVDEAIDSNDDESIDNDDLEDEEASDSNVEDEDHHIEGGEDASAEEDSSGEDSDDEIVISVPKKKRRR
eukprot:Nitzschia sp. Nitz4//scaffold246_size28974//15038//16567//NITZ4_008084-RA/size28974-processed-gene-0.11-mRNA-1//1//CDS//3329543918//3517//frame0